MDALFALPWRHGPALALTLLGVALIYRGLRGMPNPTRQSVDIMRWLRGFRRAVVGFCLALAGLAWLYQLPWLLAIALGVGLQEWRESTHYIDTLGRATRRRRAQAG